MPFRFARARPFAVDPSFYWQHFGHNKKLIWLPYVQSRITTVIISAAHYMYVHRFVNLSNIHEYAAGSNAVCPGIAQSSECVL